MTEWNMEPRGNALGVFVDVAAALQSVVSRGQKVVSLSQTNAALVADNLAKESATMNSLGALIHD